MRTSKERKVTVREMRTIGAMIKVFPTDYNTNELEDLKLETQEITKRITKVLDQR